MESTDTLIHAEIGNNKLSAAFMVGIEAHIPLKEGLFIRLLVE